MRQQGSGTLVLAGLSAGPREAVMRLEQLYRIRFSYPDGWKVDLEGEWEQHLYSRRGAVKAGSAAASVVSTSLNAERSPALSEQTFVG